MFCKYKCCFTRSFVLYKPFATLDLHAWYAVNLSDPTSSIPFLPRSNPIRISTFFTPPYSFSQFPSPLKYKYGDDGPIQTILYSHNTSVDSDGITPKSVMSVHCRPFTGQSKSPMNNSVLCTSFFIQSSWRPPILVH